MQSQTAQHIDERKSQRDATKADAPTWGHGRLENKGTVEVYYCMRKRKREINNQRGLKKP